MSHPGHPPLPARLRWVPVFAGRPPVLCTSLMLSAPSSHAGPAKGLTRMPLRPVHGRAISSRPKRGHQSRASSCLGHGL